MTESIHTLQEFMFQTKGMCYLLALCFFVGIITFWRFLNRNDLDQDMD